MLSNIDLILWVGTCQFMSGVWCSSINCMGLIEKRCDCNNLAIHGQLDLDLICLGIQILCCKSLNTTHPHRIISFYPATTLTSQNLSVLAFLHIVRINTPFYSTIYHRNNHSNHFDTFNFHPAFNCQPTQKNLKYPVNLQQLVQHL